MSKKIKNATQLPKVYYGLHMMPGVAEYKEEGKEAYRIFVGEETIKNMDASFQGRPVYVKHVDEVDLENIQNEADGYVVESFFNKADGKHWAKFIVVSDKGHTAIRDGWRLSNAYIPQQMDQGGLWNGVEFEQEVKKAEYEHLAIVNNPRYAESIILTPEQFKKYNDDKEQALKRVANSSDKKIVTKKETKKGDSMFKIFKREKVENSLELEETMVELPKSKKEMSIAQVINEYDKVVNMAGYASPDHMVKVGNEEMTVENMSKAYCSMLEEKKNAEEAKKNADEEEKKKENCEKPEDKKDNADEEEKKENEESDEKKENEDDESMDNADDEEKEEPKKSNAHFEKLKNAQDNGSKREERTLDTTDVQVKRGQSRYGSN